MAKKKVKYASASAKRAALEADEYRRERDKRLGITYKPIKSSAKEYVMNTSYRGSDQKVGSVPLSGGICAKPKDKKYTGTLIKGIATMHKSNAVPVIDEQQMIEISRMRRG